jgi:type II secretion system protein C
LETSSSPRPMSVDWFKVPDKIFAPETRSQINKIFISSTLIIGTYGTGKTVALLTKGKDKSIDKKVAALPPIKTKLLTSNEIKAIEKNNIFKTESKKPDEKKKDKKIDLKKKCLAATKKTSFPITLINTVVLQDSVKSIAAVQVRSKKGLMNVREGQIIDKFAKVDKITRLELILKNLKNGECEYLRSKKLLKKKMPVTVLSPKASKDYKKQKKAATGITNDGNTFNISKKYIQGKMKDISQILTQARAIPLKNPDGSMAFKITEIIPDSIFSNLGIQDNDIITEINGKKITDMNEVMTLFGRINELSELSLNVQRDGRKVPLEYSFTN